MVELAFITNIGDDTFHVSRKRIGTRKLKEITIDVTEDLEFDKDADLSDPEMTLPRMVALIRIGMEEKCNLEMTMLLLVSEIVNMSNTVKELRTAQDTVKEFQIFSEFLNQAFKDFVSMEMSYLMLKQIVVRCEEKLHNLESETALYAGKDVVPFEAAWTDLEYPAYKYVIYEALGKCPSLDVGIRKEDHTPAGYATELIKRAGPLLDMALYDFSPYEF